MAARDSVRGAEQAKNITKKVLLGGFLWRAANRPSRSQGKRIAVHNSAEDSKEQTKIETLL